MTVFPTGYTTKATPDGTDVVWSSDAITNFNLTIASIALYTMTNSSTTDLSEGTNLYYTDARVNTVIGTKTTDDITEGATNKYASTANVDAAGATMNTDTSLVGNSYFLDEDNMISDDATKVPSQQSVKAYVDSQSLLSEIVSVPTLTFDDVAQSDVIINHNLGVIPKRLDFIFPVLTYNRIGQWADNNGTKTSLAYIANGSDIRAITTNEAIATWDDSNNSNGERRVSAISTTQVTLSYTIVFDGGSWVATTENPYVVISA